jgi:hypothetical protein
MTSSPKSLVVLCFSAHDATGASGMTADIEAIVLPCEYRDYLSECAGFTNGIESNTH